MRVTLTEAEYARNWASLGDKKEKSMFVTLTRTGGQEVLLNMAQVVSVKDRSDQKNVVVTTADGEDFEVTEEFGDVRDRVMGNGPS